MDKISVETIQFLIRLRAINVFWYGALLRCARQNARLSQKCINEAVKTLSYAQLKAENVNPFEVCYAVNSGIVSSSLEPLISTKAFEIYRDSVIRRFNAEFTK